jgi:hypothetical protein
MVVPNKERKVGKLETVEQKVTLTKAPKYEVNPFIEAVVVKTRSKKLTVARGGMIVDQSTGEIEGLTEVAQVVEVDEGQFVKIFTKDLAVWFDLSKTGIRVFGALLATVQEQAIMRDSVFFDYNHPKVSEFKIAKNTFYRGIEELLEKKFIARGRATGWYFTNPAMFFNGNRARFIKEYRVKETPKQIDKENNLELPFLDGEE